MAITHLIPHHISSRTIAESMRNRFDYGQNPVKTLSGFLMRAYECDPMTADAEFLLAKAMYKAITSRGQEWDADVLCYQIRQSFPPGELSPQDALDIGDALDQEPPCFFRGVPRGPAHPHVHIYYNSTALDCTRKFRNFFYSSFALRRLSNRVCLEHELSVIQNPKLHSKGQFLHYGEWLGENRSPSFKEQLRAAMDTTLSEQPADLPAFLTLLQEVGIEVIHGRGGVLSFRLPGQERTMSIGLSSTT